MANPTHESREGEIETNVEEMREDLANLIPPARNTKIAPN